MKRMESRKETRWTKKRRKRKETWDIGLRTKDCRSVPFFLCFPKFSSTWLSCRTIVCSVTNQVRNERHKDASTKIDFECNLGCLWVFSSMQLSIHGEMHGMVFIMDRRASQVVSTKLTNNQVGTFLSLFLVTEGSKYTEVLMRRTSESNSSWWNPARAVLISWIQWSFTFFSTPFLINMPIILPQEQHEMKWAKKNCLGAKNSRVKSGIDEMRRR